MKKIAAFTLFLFFTIALSAQRTKKPAPFIIKGQLTNCKLKFLEISFADENDHLRLWDTVSIDPNGKLFLKTYKISRPQKALLYEGGRKVATLLVAPGYELTITADGKDHYALYETIKITGIGAESNQYEPLLDSVYKARKIIVKTRTELDEMVANNKKDMELRDSVAAMVFSKKAKHDPWHDHFAKMIHYDNLFWYLHTLFTYVNYNDKLNAEQSKQYLYTHFDSTILNDLFREEYMISDIYKEWVMEIGYIGYLIKLECLKDPKLKWKKGHGLDLVYREYKGPIKEIELHKFLLHRIMDCRTVAEFNDCRKNLQPYMAALSKDCFKTSIAGYWERTAESVLIFQVATPAPTFALPSHTGDTQSLASYKGKLVYLDLWESRNTASGEETIALKKLVDKYKHDNRIVFISIAINSEFNNWKKALEDTKPTWPQLWDNNGTLAHDYVPGTVPRFVLINKKGDIVSLNAPRPGSGEKIEQLLNAELTK
jgi:peroxiredoxin